ncbi:hypothetical protein AAFC00_000181 [Neodothiora populina]|uniref:Uncharacterized protein n=1 Tax=Neodothiora populina TaxID=2781224 RepID=A0ABR3P213_9PEZI
MDSTTLMTFWFKTPQDVRSVDIYGSWDNFTIAYPMQADAHRGRGSWTACPKFENIICDGNTSTMRSKPRQGALMQGGRYWYYFKTDDLEECYDLFKSCTAACPLLPGQMVNVLEVPVEVVEPPQRVSSASASMACSLQTPVMTRDPADRYRKVQRQPPANLPRYYSSYEALREKACGFTPSIMERGGPVRRPVRMSPVPQQRLDSAGKKSLKRLRGESPAYQALGTAFASSGADMDSVTDADGPLPVLRPFGPMPGFVSDDRPATRRGSSQGRKTPIGLGISALASFGETPGADTSLTYVDSDDGSFWSFPHPNPLRANPNQVIPPQPAHSYPSPAPTSASPSPSWKSCEPIQEGDEEWAHGDLISTQTVVAGAGPLDMVSPTFTALTAASSPSPSPRDGSFDLCDNFSPHHLSQLNSLAYDLSNDRHDVDNLSSATLMPPLSSSGKSVNATAQELRQQPSRYFDAVVSLDTFVDVDGCHRMSLDGRHHDFAEDVFDALGFECLG